MPTFGSLTEPAVLRLLNILLANLAVFGVAAAVSSSCTIQYPTTAFRCSPAGGDPTCPTQSGDEYICCSDDPSALDIDDLTADVLPGYLGGRGGSGTPIFSGGNNVFSTSGMCVRSGGVPIEGALEDGGARGCPVPCNPTWSDDDVETVCGANTLCCQTVELEPEDCVLEDGCWRPAIGTDIQGVGDTDLTRWAPNDHRTHQDPGGGSCQEWVTAVSLERDIDTQAVLRACFRRLTVADQRGFCLGMANAAACPLTDPSYVDACEQRNLAAGNMDC